LALEQEPEEEEIVEEVSKLPEVLAEDKGE
jgi:hypothetical protein